MSDITERYEAFNRQTRWYKHHGGGDAPELAYLTLGLVGESGEFADAFKKHVRKHGFDSQQIDFKDGLHLEGTFDKLVPELGDVIWYVQGLLDFLELSMEDLMVINALKLWYRCVDSGKIDPLEVPNPFPVVLATENAIVSTYRDTLEEELG